MATEYTPEQVSMFGASVSVGIDTKGYRLGLGATGYFGRGDALSFTIGRDTQIVGYRRTRATTSALVLYISGAVSVASKGAKDVQGKIQDKKKNKENGDESEDENGTANENRDADENESASEPSN